MIDKPDYSDLEFQICQYLDGQMPRRQAARFERRLRADPHLRRQLHHYATLQSHLLEIGRTEPPDIDYDAQRADIMAALERKVLVEGLPRRRRVIPGVFGVVAAAAAVAVIATVSLLQFRPRPRPQPVVEVTMLPVGVPGQASATMAVLPAPAGRGDEVQVAAAWRPPTEEDMAVPPPRWDVEVPDPSGQILLGFGPSTSTAEIGYPMFIQ